MAANNQKRKSKPQECKVASTKVNMSVREKIERLITDNRVFIFSKSYCPFCNKVKDLFTGLKVQFEALELDLLGVYRKQGSKNLKNVTCPAGHEDEGAEIQSALAEKTGQKTVPSVFVNGNHVGGSDSTFKAHEDGTLLQMLQGTYIKYDYDLVVIGGGSGGLAASKEAARFGKKVAVCDFVTPTPIGTTWGLGGTCVNVGCIPKKLMHKASLLGEDLKDAPYFGWEISNGQTHNWDTMVQNVQAYIKSLNFGYRKALKSSNVTYLNEYAKFLTPNKIQTKDKKNVIKDITARDFIIAVGGRPNYPDVPGAREFGITSDDLFSLPYCPGKTLLVGASYIALECAGFLAGFGLDVTVMVRSILLRGFDRQMAELIGDHMSVHGVKFIAECVPTSIDKLQDGTPGLYKVTGVNSDGSTMEAEFNTIVFAVGREACTQSLGLDNIGVQLNTKNGKIKVNEQEQSSMPNIYAVGDVIDEKPELTPVAIQAGKLLAQRLYGKQARLTDYASIPTTVFTPLEYGCVGLSEEDAIAKYGADNIEVYHSFYQPLEFALSGRDGTKPYGKLICVKNENERIVGFHVLGPNAGEITQGFAIGLKLGAKKEDFANLIGIHPTCAEIFTTMNVTKSSGESVEKSGC